MSTRIYKIRNKLRKLQLDAFFVTNQHNVTYLTGFSGLSSHEREGFLFITQKEAFLLTFPTYFGLYEKGGDGFTTLNITQAKKITHHLSKIIQREKIKSAGFEKENLTVAELHSLKRKLKIKFAPTLGIVENLRIIKDNNELQNIKKAAQITDLAFDFMKTKIASMRRKRGITEKELALELEFFLKKNADDVAFSPIVAFNKNAAIPHYLPTHNSQLTTHNLVLLDFGAKIDGYCADMTRVIFFGTPKETWVRIYETVLQAQKLALSKLRADIAASSIDKIARNYIIKAGFPQYPHGLGHGVGLAIHEDPRLRVDNKEILKENMVVTVEPGIYLPGEGGVRIEDLVVLKKDGIEILSKSPKELTIL